MNCEKDPGVDVRAHKTATRGEYQCQNYVLLFCVKYQRIAHRIIKLPPPPKKKTYHWFWCVASSAGSFGSHLKVSFCLDQLKFMLIQGNIIAY